VGRSPYRELPNIARDALFHVAEEEVRSPSEQIAWYVLDGLRRAGALPVALSASDPAADTAQALPAQGQAYAAD
jgi:hypothetical protein